MSTDTTSEEFISMYDDDIYSEISSKTRTAVSTIYNYSNKHDNSTSLNQDSRPIRIIKLNNKNKRRTSKKVQIPVVLNYKQKKSLVVDKEDIDGLLINRFNAAMKLNTEKEKLMTGYGDSDTRYKSRLRSENDTIFIKASARRLLAAIRERRKSHKNKYKL